MDWRTPLRKLVNQENYLRGWRLAIMRIIDPVEWYMGKNDEENERPFRRRWRQRATGWTAYAPLEEGPGRIVAQRLEGGPEGASAPHPERRALEEHRRFHERLVERRERGRETHAAWREGLERDFSSYFEAKARELLAGRTATIETTGGTVRARLLRFRNGAVFEHEHTSQSGSGRGMTRIERPQLADPVPLIVGYLVQSVLNLEVGARPLGES